jgi:hypothetical protein
MDTTSGNGFDIRGQAHNIYRSKAAIIGVACRAVSSLTMTAVAPTLNVSSGDEGTSVEVTNSDG